MEIATFFRLSTRQVDAAVRYIEDHQDEVMEEYRRILERWRSWQSPGATSQARCRTRAISGDGQGTAKGEGAGEPR